MKVRDKQNRVFVEVCESACPKKECYWPRPDPGVFTQGVGYRTRNFKGQTEWLCGNREVRGCPSAGTCLNCHTIFVPDRKVCTWCGQELRPGGRIGRPQA